MMSIKGLSEAVITFNFKDFSASDEYAFAPARVTDIARQNAFRYAKFRFFRWGKLLNIHCDEW